MSESKDSCPYMQNRELSWLRFDARILEEADTRGVPPLERLRFLGIYEKNLYEFYQVRVEKLLLRLEDPTPDGKSGLTPREQFFAVLAATSRLDRRRDEVYIRLRACLREHEVWLLELSELTTGEQDALENWYSRILFPQLKHGESPPASGACLAIQTDRDWRFFPLPSPQPVALALPGPGTRFAVVEEYLLRGAQQLLSGEPIKNRALLSLTPGAQGHGPVRAEMYGELDAKSLGSLCQRLDLLPSQIFVRKTPFHLSKLLPLLEERTQALTYPEYHPGYPAGLCREEDVLYQVLQKDILFAYPYDSMEALLHLLKDAGNDPRVESIQITLSRLAENSRLAAHLMQAARKGKRVVALLEQRARFDEERNQRWARRLACAGCQVLAGPPQYKVHAKLCLISLRDRGVQRRLSYIGTGNFNEDSARHYADFGLLTAHPQIGEEVEAVFAGLGVQSVHFARKFEHLLLSPTDLLSRLMRLMNGQIEKVRRGEFGRILLKLNSLTHRGLMDKLCEAAQAGVQVDLIVRGICCLLPGVPGYTERVRVVSVVGRFLEHSRIYCFGEHAQDGIYLSSADLMGRNMSRRLEVACPVYSHSIARRIFETLELMLRDRAGARLMLPSGEYQRLAAQGDRLDSQLLQLERTQYRNHPPAWVGGLAWWRSQK